jgi:hypothetical protein
VLGQVHRHRLNDALRPGFHLAIVDPSLVIRDGLRLRQAVGGLSDTDLVAVNTLLVPFSPTADGAGTGTPGDGLSILSGSSATAATTGPISTPSVTAGSVQANEPVKPSTGLPVKPARRAKGKPTP